MRVVLVACWALLVGACSGDQAPADDGGSGGGGDGGAAVDLAQPAGGDLAVSYHPVTLGFDDVATGTAVTNQYAAYATFSSDAGCSCRASSDAGLAASPPNYLFTFYTCPSGPTASVFVDFAKPVRGLSFKGIGINNTGKVATLHVVTAAGTQSMDLVGQGNVSKPVVVDLSSFTDVTRLEIVNVTDFEGLGVDDVAFEFPQ